MHRLCYDEGELLIVLYINAIALPIYRVRISDTKTLLMTDDIGEREIGNLIVYSKFQCLIQIQLPYLSMSHTPQYFSSKKIHPLKVDKNINILRPFFYLKIRHQVRNSCVECHKTSKLKKWNSVEINLFLMDNELVYSPMNNCTLVRNLISSK